MGADSDDGALVLAARAGDKAAFAELLTRHRPLVVTLCERMLGDAFAAEDAAQEASLQALLGLESLRRAEQFGPWLAGIGLNICRRWLRAHSRECWSWDALIGGRHLPEPLTWQDDPAAQAEAADVVARIQRAVAALPSGQRAAVLLFYLSGLTYAETAVQLGIEVKAVKTRLRRARETLRQRLHGEWKEEAMTTDTGVRFVEMQVTDVRRRRAEGERTSGYAVILQEVGGARRLVIWIGTFEAEALACQLEHIEFPRPLIYTLTARMLEAMGGRLEDVRVVQLADTVFYAELVVTGPQGQRSVDARPSDAFNLALLTGVPIHVAPAVLEAAGVPPEGEDGAARPGLDEMRTFLSDSEGAAEIVAAAAVLGKPQAPRPEAGETCP
jgi:RNA polymerase sigma-70 factor (ECF subfamily)